MVDLRDSASQVVYDDVSQKRHEIFLSHYELIKRVPRSERRGAEASPGKGGLSPAWRRSEGSAMREVSSRRELFGKLVDAMAAYVEAGMLSEQSASTTRFEGRTSFRPVPAQGSARRRPWPFHWSSRASRASSPEGSRGALKEGSFGSGALDLLAWGQHSMAESVAQRQAVAEIPREMVRVTPMTAPVSAPAPAGGSDAAQASRRRKAKPVTLQAVRVDLHEHACTECD